MTKRLALRRETITDLTADELAHVAAAATWVCLDSKLCPFTIGDSCGIVCITVGLQCFTDDCPPTTRAGN